MDYQKIKVVSILLFITGATFLFAQYQGVSGFAIGGESSGGINLGAIIILLSLIIYVAVSRLQNLDDKLIYDHKVDHTELRRQQMIRAARVLFIEMYAREPSTRELEHFIERMKNEGKLKI